MGLLFSVKKKERVAMGKKFSFPLKWARHFAEVPNNDLPISQFPEYKEAKIYPMDPSSYLAVSNLELNSGQNVLDLCCAPGGKMILINDFLDGTGSITGVDISKPRLSTTATLVKRHHVPFVRLFLGDGTTAHPPVHSFPEQMSENTSKSFNELYPTKEQQPFYSTSPYRNKKGILFEDGRYDRVIVDAQCTHDGSVKHVRKHVNSEWKNFDDSHYSPESLNDLYELQYKLLVNGFDCLKNMGILVYSTCSLSPRQNELIIDRFLENHPEAKVLDPVGPREYKFKHDGRKYLRIMPSIEMGGGFFVCKIRKES